MIVQEKISLSFADVSLVKDKIICVDFLNEEPVCDCGAEKTNVPHATWCSTNEI